MSRTMPEPVAITADVDARTVRIEWADGQENVYDFEQLRWACPCAHCRGEMGQPGVLDFTDRLTPEQTELVNIEAVGHYAIRPTFTDGHGSGIFSWDYLYDLGERQDENWARYLERLAAAGASRDPR